MLLPERTVVLANGLSYGLSRPRVAASGFADLTEDGRGLTG